MDRKKKIVELAKNFSFTLISNLVSVVISSIVILIIPNFIEVEEYGYWQLYIFYTTYVGLLHFGWNDGIYLREGGAKYDALNKSIYFSQFYMLLFLQLTIAIVGGILTYIFVSEPNKQFVLYMT